MGWIRAREVGETGFQMAEGKKQERRVILHERDHKFSLPEGGAVHEETGKSPEVQKIHVYGGKCSRCVCPTICVIISHVVPFGRLRGCERLLVLDWANGIEKNRGKLEQRKYLLGIARPLS